jgi:hypothetical protein
LDKFSYPGLKAVSSNASRGWMLCFFSGDDWAFLKDGAKPYLITTKAPLGLKTILMSSHL